MSKSFRECAEHYLGQWCELDREFWTHFSRAPVSCELLAKMCGKYGVARTIPGHGAKRYLRFAKTLDRYRHKKMTRQSMCATIQRQQRNLQRHGKSFLSAITKAFWMMKRHPVVIYDSNARAGLRCCRLRGGAGNYAEYCKSWFQFFDDPATQRQLDAALHWLPRSARARRLLKQRKVSESELRSLCQSQWFRNRVTDMYLFYLGKPD